MNIRWPSGRKTPLLLGRPDPTTGKDSRHPDEFLLLLLCLISGLGIVFGDIPEPGSIEAAVHPWAAQAWGIGLLLGPIVTLVGIFWQDRLSGAIVEQVGQIITGGVALFYATVILVELGLTGAVSAFIIIAFGAARIWRWAQLQRLLNRAQVEQNRVADRDDVPRHGHTETHAVEQEHRDGR